MQHLRIYDLKRAVEFYRLHRELVPGEDALLLVEDGRAVLAVFAIPEVEAAKVEAAPSLIPPIPGLCPRGALGLEVTVRTAEKESEVYLALPFTAWKEEFKRMARAETVRVLLLGERPKDITPLPGGVLALVRWPVTEFDDRDLPDLLPMVAALLVGNALLDARGVG